MRHVDEYRDPELAKKLALAIRTAMADHGERLRFMEVCGTHTMAVGRYGLRQLFPHSLELISGPGCPVCVTPTAEVDQALELAGRPGIILASFGDMLRVPGSSRSLSQARAEGARTALVYSSFEALELARRQPSHEVVFWGVGFETTSPTVAAAVLTARTEGLGNFSVLSSHRLLPPALRSLLSSGLPDLQGFLLPGHVSTTIGAKSFQFLAQRFGLACVVGGFEPTDILGAVLMLVRQCAAKSPRLEIQYRRAASYECNARALAVLEEVFQTSDSLWRGLGVIPQSGLALRPDFQQFDAAHKFGLTPAQNLQDHNPPGCQCGQVLRGLLRPPQCPLFDKACKPQNPVGPCMVSSEGACAAYYKYERKP